MSIALPSVGTPANPYDTNWTPSYREKLVWKLKKFAGRIAEVTFGCHHRNITIPLNDHQTCLDCGATRLYLYNPAMYLAGVTYTPVFIGRWKKALAPLPTQSEPATPKPRQMDGRAAILNPGSENALFQPRSRETAVRG